MEEYSGDVQSIPITNTYTILLVTLKTNMKAEHGALWKEIHAKLERWPPL